MMRCSGAVRAAAGTMVGVVVGMVALPAMLIALAAPVGASNDAYFDRQWALAQIRAPQAWTKSTGSGITIGIVDTGIDATHPDLVGKVVATADCIGQPCAAGGIQDSEGHGTIISGIAAAVTNNGRGVAGVAPDARLVVAKVLNSNGEGRAGDINNGIRWVVDQGARVVNLSLGDPNVSVTNVSGTPLRSGIEYAWSRGAVPVLASGNFGTGSDVGGGSYAGLNALVVGATSRGGAVSSYSSSVGNAKWGLVAPGGSGTGGADANVLSTFPVSAGGSGYASAGGTSMAAPHVAGAVALLLAQGISPTAAVNQLLSTLDKSSPCGLGCQGRLDVAAAVGAGPVVAPPSAITVPPTTVSPTTVAPTTVAPAPTTTRQPTSTTAPQSSSTTLPAPPPVPPRSVQAEDPSKMASPRPLDPLPFGGTSQATRRNRAVIGLSITLVVAMTAATGVVAATSRRR